MVGLVATYASWDREGANDMISSFGADLRGNIRQWLFVSALQSGIG